MNNYGDFNLEKELKNVPEEELKAFEEQLANPMKYGLFGKLLETIIRAEETTAENAGATRKNLLLTAHDMTDEQRDLAEKFYKLGLVHGDMDKMIKRIRYGHG